MWARRVREETMGTLIFVCLLGRKSRRAWKWTFRLYNDWSWEESIVHTADSSTKWLGLSIGLVRCICLRPSPSSL
jgi:hypothetical protein